MLLIFFFQIFNNSKEINFTFKAFLKTDNRKTELLGNYIDCNKWIKENGFSKYKHCFSIKDLGAEFSKKMKAESVTSTDQEQKTLHIPFSSSD